MRGRAARRPGVDTGGTDVPAPAPGDEAPHRARRRAPAGSTVKSGPTGWRDPHRARPGRLRGDDQRRRHAAGQHMWQVACDDRPGPRHRRRRPRTRSSTAIAATTAAMVVVVTRASAAASDEEEAGPARDAERCERQPDDQRGPDRQRDHDQAHGQPATGVRGRWPAWPGPRRRAGSARARPPGLSSSRWRSTGRAIHATSSGVTNARSDSRAEALAAASRCTAARGLAPSETLGSSRVRRTSDGDIADDLVGDCRSRRPPHGATSSSSIPQTASHVLERRRRDAVVRELEQRELVRLVRVADIDLQDETVELRLGQWDRCLRTRSGSASRRRRRDRATGGANPSIVTWYSCIASSSAAWVFGGVRLISSASSTFVNTGPGENASSPARRVIVPVRSDGSMSGVNWTRRKDTPSAPRHRVREQGLGHAGDTLEEHVSLNRHRRPGPGRPPRPGRRRPCGPLPRPGRAAPSRCSSLGPGERRARGQDGFSVARGSEQGGDVLGAPPQPRRGGTDLLGRRRPPGARPGAPPARVPRPGAGRQPRPGAGCGPSWRPSRRRRRGGAAEADGRSPPRVRSGGTRRSRSASAARAPPTSATFQRPGIAPRPDSDPKPCGPSTKTTGRWPVPASATPNAALSA